MMALQSTTNPFDSTEAKLQAILRPIRPSKKFVQTVRSHIEFSPPIQLAEKSPQVQHFLLVLGGVLSASLLIITVVRAIFYLVNRSKA